MNHYQDIDDGLAEYESARERTEAEERFKSKPTLFNQKIWGIFFVATRVEELIFSGPRTQDRDSIFAFESGYAAIEGKSIPSLDPYTLTIRWSSNGEHKETLLSNRDRPVAEFPEE